MADIGVPVAFEVAKCLKAPVGRHCSYVIFCDRYVGQLNGEVEKLGDTRDQVQHSIDEARNNMKPIKTTVARWVNEVEAVANEVRDVLDYDEKAKKTCFYGWLPNPKARYHLGKEARRTVKDIQALIAGGQFTKVYFENPPRALVGGASNVNFSAGDRDFITGSRASVFQGIIEALNDEKVKVVGVYGPGGVGKSTLLKIVEKKLRIDGRPFCMIVKAEVSQAPDLIDIQGQIAGALSLNLKVEEARQGRSELLSQRLQSDPNEKFLIILDDLWEELDLEAVGIPSNDKSMNCKLLLTSRDKIVLEQRMHADQTFCLKSLEDDEALKLFEKIVGNELRDDKELKVKAAQVVAKLAGLPLLINSVANTLKCSDVFRWEDMLRRIDDKNNRRIVKWSYDHLESEDVKCLFLLCGLIGGTIRVELLLGLGMGLSLFGRIDDTMQSLRNRLHTMLIGLQSFCLLQDGGDGKENVTIHDLYSGVVVSDVFNGQNSLIINNNYGLWPKEKLDKCWACLVNVGSDRLVELTLCQFPHVKILVLSEQYDMGDCSRMDFKYMGELRVLYLGSMRITSLPSSMEILRNLQSLSISCHVEDVANLGKLKALQILSFVGSVISKLPKEIGKLTNLRSLNLSNCYSLEIIEPEALKDLISLEELHMKESFDQWRGKHELAELKSLTKLASLEISIFDPMILLTDGDLPFEKLEKFWINIGDAEAREYEGLTTMKLNLKGCDSILSRKWVEKNMQKTQCLYLSNLSELAGRPCELCTQGFPEVKYLDIEDSPSIKYVADSSNCPSLTDFGKLESLFLKNLTNLEEICHGPITPGCFNKLKAVRVGQCHRLKYLWRLSDVQKLVWLEEIEVSNCDSMQSIVTHDAGEDIGEDIVSANNRVKLPNVHPPVLSEFPTMTSFCTKAEITSEDTPIQVSLPHLESPEMVGLLGVEEILCSEHSLKYSNLRSPRLTLDRLPNLRDLHVYKTGLSFLFSVSVAKCFKEIRAITVSSCPNMKAVIVDEGRNEGTYDIIEFPLLEYLSIWQCPMEKFFSYPCGKKEPVTTTSDSQDANSDSFFDRKVSLPSLEFLWLHLVGSFKRIWQDELPRSFFCELANLIRENCFELLNVFSLTIIGRLHNLKEVTFPNITVLEIDGLKCKELWNDQIPTDSFLKLESLKLENCDNLRHIAPPQMWKVLQRCLKNLEVISCRLIEIIYEEPGMDIEGGELRELLLRDLENVKHIWQSKDLPNIPFPNLIDVEVVRCPHLEVLFTTFTATFLGQIKELVVESCEKMKLIACHQKGQRTVTTVTFSKLSVLRLFELPEFRRFSLPEEYSLDFWRSEEFPSLKVLSIKRCGKRGLDLGCGNWESHQEKRRKTRKMPELQI